MIVQSIFKEATGITKMTERTANKITEIATKATKLIREPINGQMIKITITIENKSAKTFLENCIINSLN
jgi:hypothetical protein